MNSVLTIPLIGIATTSVVAQEVVFSPEQIVFLRRRCGRCSRSIAIHAAAFGQTLTEAAFNDLLGYLLGETAGK